MLEYFLVSDLYLKSIEIYDYSIEIQKFVAQSLQCLKETFEWFNRIRILFEGINNHFYIHVLLEVLEDK